MAAHYVFARRRPKEPGERGMGKAKIFGMTLREHSISFDIIVKLSLCQNASACKYIGILCRKEIRRLKTEKNAVAVWKLAFMKTGVKKGEDHRDRRACIAEGAR